MLVVDFPVLLSWPQVSVPVRVIRYLRMRTIHRQLLACNIFQAFLALNLKPQIRKGGTQVFWPCLMAAEIHDGINLSRSP